MIFIGVAITGINLLQGLVLSVDLKKNILEDDLNKYSNIVHAYVVSIEDQFESYFSALDYYVNADIVKTEDEEAIREWLYDHVNERNKVFTRVLWCGQDGTYYSDDKKSGNISDRSYFKAIFNQSKDRFIDDPVISRSDNSPVVHITRRVTVGGKTLGLFCGVLTLDYINSTINNIKVGESGYAIMIANDGTVMAHPNSSYIMNNNFITGLSKGFEDMQKATSSVVRGESGSQWVKGLNGNAKDLIVYETIPFTKWGLLISLKDTEIFSTINLTYIHLVTGAIVSIILLLLISGLLLYASIKPLSIVENTIRGIASGDADLSKRIDVFSNNEIGFVVQGFNNFIGKLQAIISEVKDSKEELKTAGEDMTASADDTASAINQIIENIENMRKQILSQHSSVQGTAGAVSQIASNIQSLERMIEGQSAGVSEASAAVEEMIGNISSVNNSVEKMAESFDSLRTDAKTGFDKQQDVNERIKLIESQSEMLQEANAAISSIAEQTNLLAMNAAIEAAHAGEAGKGFSVVADEIRKLSETSTSQSKTIGEQLNNIKESIGQVVAASTESSRAFESVSVKIDDTDQLVMQIKAAMEEQNTGSQQISNTLHNMNDSTIEVRNASKEMTAGNKAILEEIEKLQNATASMKDTMEEMAAGARKIDETGNALSDISNKVKDSITKIGKQIDQFRV